MADLAATLRANAQRTAAIVAHARRTGQATRRTRMPAYQWPARIEEDYARAIAAAADVRDDLEPLMRALPELLRGAAQALGRADEGESARARQLLQRARARLEASLGDHTLEPTTRRYAHRTLAHHQGQLQRQMRAKLGVDLQTADPGAAALVEAFVSENVALIRSLGTRTLDEVASLVTRAFGDGARAESVVEEIQARYGIAERHARLIARDQVGKLNGRIAAARHQELGFGSFKWRSMKDQRVRPRHVHLDGQVFRYPEGAPGEGIPGHPIQCRCFQEPVVDDILAELEALEAGEGGGGAPPPGAGVPGQVGAAAGAAAGAPPAGAGGGGRGRGGGGARPPAGGGGGGRRKPPLTEAQRAALAEIEAEKKRPMATALHHNMRDPNGVLTPEARARLERRLEASFGRRVPFEELSHAFAVPDGYEAELVSVAENSVYWNLYSAGPPRRKIGELARDFDDTGGVHHGFLKLIPEFRGKGISDVINGNALRRYEKWGVKRIEVQATSAGRYSWARLGFDYADSRQKTKIMRDLSEYLERVNIPAADRVELLRKARAMRPSELAELDYNGLLFRDEYNSEDEHGNPVGAPDVPLGKAFLLSKSCHGWQGKIPINRRSDAYLHAIAKAKVAR